MAFTTSRNRTYSSGELAKLSGVPFENIRYFETIGLIPPPRRAANGRRVFADIHHRKLVFIRRARELGFSQEEVRALLQLSDGTPSLCAEVKALADTHLASVRNRLAALRKMEELLADVSSRCGTGSTAACPIIDVLYSDDARELPTGASSFGGRLVLSLLAQDLEQTLAFYRKIGFRHCGGTIDSSWIEVRIDDAVLQFYCDPPVGTAATPQLSGTIYVHVYDVDAMCDRLTAVTRLEWGPQSMEYGMRECAVRDPDGYLLAFASPLAQGNEQAVVA
jgi:MerR family mercuric resistance operon transcriptional regulator